MTDEQLNARFDRVDTRFDQVNARFDALYDYLLNFKTEVIQRLDSIDRRIALLTASADSVQAIIPALTKQSHSMEERMSAVEQRLRRLEGVA